MEAMNYFVNQSTLVIVILRIMSQNSLLDMTFDRFEIAEIGLVDDSSLKSPLLASSLNSDAVDSVAYPDGIWSARTSVI